MCDLFTMIIMSRSNYLLFVNDCPKYSGFCVTFLLTILSCMHQEYVYNDTVDYNCVLVSTIVLIKMTV